MTNGIFTGKTGGNSIDFIGYSIPSLHDAFTDPFCLVAGFILLSLLSLF